MTAKLARQSKLDDDDDDDFPAPAGTIELVANGWETPALAAEVSDIVASIEAPPVDAEVMLEFQKTLYRGRMFNVDGRGRIVLACRCFLESEGNAGAFAEPFVSAVLSAACTEEFAGCGLELIEAFDQIRLVETFETMRSLEYFGISDAKSVLSQIVRNKLRRILTPPQPESVKPPSKKERLAADKQATAAARLAEIERNLDLGRTLIALRDRTPCNELFGWAVRTQFDLDRQHVAEMTRVARRYGDRPEIYRKAKLWRVLVRLSSTALPESRRQAFERRIVAGENVKAKEIAE
jgi:hypothetical protein